MKKSVLARGALLAGLIFLCYWPALHGGFTFDDNVTLTDNPLLKASDGFSRLWWSRDAVDYWPVTATSFWAEWRLWGLHPAGYHVTNVALHLADCLLFWALLSRLRVPGAYLAAVLFALHPVNVESVAWITQRKGLLALLFFLLALHGCVSASARERIAVRWMLASLGAFVVALLCKGSVVTLPLVLAGLWLWHGRLARREWAWLAAFAAVGAGVAGWEAQFRTVGSAAGLDLAEGLTRLAGAGAALVFYLRQSLWPHPLMFVYPLWPVDPAAARWWLPLFSAVLFTIWLWRGRRSWSRPYLFAWGYFIAVLLPVLGLVRVGYMKYSLVADHYAHLALLGVVALASATWVRLPPTAWTRACTVAGVALLGFLTWRQANLYADARTLYLAALESNPGCWLAENNLGALALEAGRPAEAIGRFEAALRLHPDDAATQNNLGLARARIGRLPDAMVCYAKALQLDPTFSRAENNWGVALARLNHLAEATGHFARAVRLDPDYFEGHLNLAHALALAGDPAGAREHYTLACRLNPSSDDARRGLAQVSTP